MFYSKENTCGLKNKWKGKLDDEKILQDPTAIEAYRIFSYNFFLKTCQFC